LKTKPFKHKTVNLITLGCAKNLVDSEVMLRQLHAAGLETMHDADTFAEIVLINTCGFINDAKEESVNTIMQWVNAKNLGQISQLYVMGCLSQRYRDELSKEIPEVDGFFGVNDFAAILASLNAPYREDLIGERAITTPKHYAYLKISEGCDRSCSFCAIPGIRGGNISRSIESLVKETQFLASAGVKELILIAQDLTYYGIDLYGKRKLATLLDALAEIEGIEWFRLHYAYPAGFPMQILDAMNRHPKICRYLDIPLQHINSRILKSMKRGMNAEKTLQLISSIRQKVPGIIIRSSFIVGYPGETKEEFHELKEFIEEVKFERVGVFTYSPEENTAAARLTDDVRPAVKARRAEEIMRIQQDISIRFNQDRVGKQLEVIIDRKEGEFYIGRTRADSPEVDNEVIISDTKGTLGTGQIVTVNVTNAEMYDLIAEF